MNKLYTKINTFLIKEIYATLQFENPKAAF